MSLARSKVRGRRFEIVLLLIMSISIIILGVTMSGKTGPSWNGVTIGETTEHELVAILGQPSEIRRGLFARNFYYHSTNVHWAAHMITIRGNRVVRIEENMSVYFPEPVFTYEFIQRYGDPDVVFWSRHSPGERILVYLDDGIMLNVTAVAPIGDSKITHAYYYQPCSLMCVQLKFLRKMSHINPFPNSDVVGPRDPWLFED